MPQLSVVLLMHASEQLKLFLWTCIIESSGSALRWPGGCTKPRSHRGPVQDRHHNIPNLHDVRVPRKVLVHRNCCLDGRANRKQ